MITQNPIVGRSRKKLAGVYARTLWGKNLIQSLPAPSKIPPTKALKDSRAAFGLIMQMANMVPKSLLFFLYYTAPVGRSRRHVLASQLFSGVNRDNFVVSFSLTSINQLGSNPVATTDGLLFTIPSKSFSIPISDFSKTDIADISKIPCVLAISYDLGLCVPLMDYTTISGDNLVFDNISNTFLGAEVLLLPLWQINVGSTTHPIWVYGSFAKET